MNRNLVIIIAVAVAALVTGITVSMLSRPAPPEPGTGADTAAVGDQRPSFRHGDLEGEWVSVEEFDGQVLLVNFWATWCAPCRREMPLLQETAEDRSDLALVGIAIDEVPAVRDFVDELGITYPILVGAGDVMDTQRRWGNTAGALPYTVLVDQEGIIRWQHLGEVTAEELDAVLAEWM